MLTIDPARGPRTGMSGAWRAALICVGLASGSTIAAAQSLDLDSGSVKPVPRPAPAAPSAGGLDMDVKVDAPIPPKPAQPAGDVKAGITPLGQKLVPDAAPATLTGPEPASPVDRNEAAASLPGPIALDRPKVIDTAKLQAGDTTVSLFGIQGMAGDPAQGLQAYLGQSDKPLNCQAHDAAAFVCLMGDGTDVALVALVNGAARAKADAPDVYRDQENEAQKNRRGIWSKLPPPPETVKHPTVKDTATLTGDGKTYILDGVIGLGAPYNGQLQSYIVANGDSVTCMPQGPQDHFVCLMPDGTDLAKAALVNGAARVPADTTPAYRTQQLDALNNHRGYWVSAPPDIVAIAIAPPPPDQYMFVVGDDGYDGITYVDGVPLAVIEGEPDPVFMTYDEDVGWGYYGHDGYWHGAPDRYRSHLDRFHHGGSGLRGYDHGHYASYGHEFRGGRPGEGREGLGHEAGMRGEGRPGEGRAGMEGRGGERREGEARGGERREEARGGERREGEARGGERREAEARGGERREAGMRGEGRGGEVREAGLHSEAHGAMGRPGGFGGGGAVAHPGGFGGGGGFMRPAPAASMGGFHQGLFGGGARPGGGGFGGMMHAAAPAAVARGGGGGGVKHK